VKKNFIAFLFLAGLLWMAGCQTPAAVGRGTQTALPGPAPIRLINPLGPLVIPASGIASGQVKGSVLIEVQNWKTVDEVTGLLSGNDVPFAVLPITMAANLEAGGVDLVLAGVHEWKVFYLIASQNASFSDWSSLSGKTIYTPEAKGQTVDTLTRYALIQAGIRPDEDVHFVYAPAQEIAALFKEGKVDFAALPEPYVSLALSGNSGKIVLDYQEYWSQESGAADGIPVAGLFVKKAFYQAHPDIVAAVAKTFADSIQWANANPADALQASSSILTIPSAVMNSALQRMKFEYVPAAQCKQEVLEFLTKMRNTDPEGIKAIPSDDFFAGQ